MASIEGTNGDAFPAVNAARELNLGVPEVFPVDPVSSDLETARRLKKEAEVRQRAAVAAVAATSAAEEAGKCKSDLGSVLMSTLAVSAVVAAAVGVAFIVVKKLKHI